MPVSQQLNLREKPDLVHSGYAKLEQHVNAMDAALVRDSPVEEVASDSERRVYALLAKAKRLRVSEPRQVASMQPTDSASIRPEATQQQRYTRSWRL